MLCLKLRRFATQTTLWLGVGRLSRALGKVSLMLQNTRMLLGSWSLTRNLKILICLLTAYMWIVKTSKECCKIKTLQLSGNEARVPYTVTCIFFPCLVTSSRFCFFAWICVHVLFVLHVWIYMGWEAVYVLVVHPKQLLKLAKQQQHHNTFNCSRQSNSTVPNQTSPYHTILQTRRSNSTVPNQNTPYHNSPNRCQPWHVASVFTQVLGHLSFVQRWQFMLWWFVKKANFQGVMLVLWQSTFVKICL